MRIHHIPSSTQGIVWQVTGRCVRKVLIRTKPIDNIFGISPFITVPGGAGGFLARCVHALITDLFAVEQDARIEFGRRRSLSQAPADRRRRRVTDDAGLTAGEAIAAGLAVGIACLMWCV